jgi:hypothetical protein
MAIYSGEFPIEQPLICSRYTKKSIGIGVSGGEVMWFFKTEGRDLDDDDAAVLHRMLHLWNIWKGVSTEQVLCIRKGVPVPEAQTVRAEVTDAKE